MAPARKNSTSHAPVAHLPVLKKGRACSTCKARKVKCNAATPACEACKRTARFEGRDPDLVICTYKSGRQCGTQSSGGKGSKGKASSSRQSSPEDVLSSLEGHMAEFERTLLGTTHPSRSMSSSSSSSISSSSSSERHAADERSSESPSTFAFLPSTSTYSTQSLPAPLPALILPYPLYTGANFFTTSPESHYFDFLQPDMAIPLQRASSNYDSYPPSPDSSSWSDEYLFASSSPESSYDNDFLPEHFTHSAHINDTLSPAFFPLPPLIGCIDPGSAWNSTGALFGDE